MEGCGVRFCFVHVGKSRDVLEKDTYFVSNGVLWIDKSFWMLMRSFVDLFR